MKIALIGNDFVQQFPTLSYGGIETCVENLAWELHQSGDNFFAVIPKRRIIRSYPFEIVETQCSPIGENGGSGFDFAESVKMVLQNRTFDIILSQSHWSALVLKDLGKPIICTFHDSCPKQAGWMIDHALIRYRFLSKFQYTNWVCHPWEKTKSTQIYSGLSDDQYSFEDKKEGYALWVAGFNWGIEAKGLDIFIHLATARKDIPFVAYGTGNSNIEEWLRTQAHNIPNLEYQGTLERGPSHQEAFKKASFFVMPTRTMETFARVNLEAISKGTPILGSAQGSMPEIVQDFVGIASNDVSDLIAGFDKSFDYHKIFDYSKRFHINQEIESLKQYASEEFGLC